MAVTSIFVVTTIIMVMSVIHVEMNQTIVGYEECCMHVLLSYIWLDCSILQELVCSENDEECLKLICPVGYRLDREIDRCLLKDGMTHY